MENTEKIKDMITLIEKNNENYHDAMSNLADTFNRSLSNIMRYATIQERPGRDPVTTGEQQRNVFKNPVASLYRLVSRKR